MPNQICAKHELVCSFNIHNNKADFLKMPSNNMNAFKAGFKDGFKSH